MKFKSRNSKLANMLLEKQIYRIKHLLPFIALFAGVLRSNAQTPANDNCSGAIPLSITGQTANCPTTTYTNVGATDATGSNTSPNPICFNGSRAFKDVWFTFTTTATGPQNYRISIVGAATSALVSPQAALYVGSCSTGLFEELCRSQPLGSSNTTLNFDATDLRANTTYYMQIGVYQSTDLGGRFSVCVKPFSTYTLTQTPQTSTVNQGILYDSGGPSGNYTDGEDGAADENDFTFNIRPLSGSCIEITIDSLGLEPNNDTLRLIDGVTSYVYDRISGTATEPLVFQVPTNNLKIEFRSDGSINSRGFKLSWKSLTTCTSKPTSCSAAELITGFPFQKRASTCNDLLDGVTESPCTNDDFLDGKDHIFKYTSLGGQCISVNVSDYLISAILGSPIFGAPEGINVGIYRGCPGSSVSECIAKGKLTARFDTAFIVNARLELPGDYYIVVSKKESCSPFNIRIDEVPCLNRLPNAGFCEKNLSLNDCSNKAAADIVLDLSGGGDSTFIKFTPKSINSGCISGFGGVNTYNFAFFKFKAQADGKFGFTIRAVSPNENSDIDFNVYGPITNESDVCNFAKNNRPTRSSWGQENSTFIGGSGFTGLIEKTSNLNGLDVTPTDTCEDNTGDGLLRLLDVKKDQYYIIFINDFEGSLGTDGVRMRFDGTTQGVLDSINDPLSIFRVSNDTVICRGATALLSAQGGIGYTWTPTTNLSNATIAKPTATPNQTTTYNVLIQGTCRVVPKSVKVGVFDIKDIPDATVCSGEELDFNAGENYPLSVATWTWTSSTNNLADLSCTSCANPRFKASNTSGVVETHIFTVTLNAPNCPQSKTITITVNPAPVAQYQVITSLTPKRDTNVCVGNTFRLLKSGFDNTATYTWSSTPSAGTITAPNPFIEAKVSTKYYVTVTGGAGGCPANSIDSVIVNVFQKPLINIIKDTTLCVGASIVLGSTNIEDKTTYKWTSPSGTSSLSDALIANPILTLQAGTIAYTLTATNPGKCETVQTVNVTGVDLRASIDTTDFINLCKGTPLTLKTKITPSTDVKIKWDSDRDFTFANDSSATLTVSPITRTRYFLKTTLPGCMRFDTVTILVDSLPFNRKIEGDPKPPYCEGTQITLKSPEYEPILFSGIKFKWTPNKNFITPDSLYNLVITADSTRTYTREVTNGVCKGKDTILVVVNPIPKLMVTPNETVLCINNLNPITFTAKSDRPTLTKDWKWTDPNGNELAEFKDKTVATFTPTRGTYTVTAQIENCPGSTSFEVRIAQTPSLSVPNNPVLCVGQTVKLNTAVDLNTTYVWSGPNGFTSSIGNPDSKDAGTYTVIATSANKCESRASVVVSIATATLTLTPDTTVCSGNSLTLVANGVSSTGGGAYRWNTGQTTPTIGANTSVGSTYNVTFTFGNNCTLSRAVKVGITPGLSVRINPDTLGSRLVDQGTKVSLTTTVSGNFGTPTYKWTNNGEDAGTSANLDVVFLDLNENFTVVATNPTTGCRTSAAVNVKVRIPNYQLPNSFTPNGDNNNPTFSLIFDPDNKSGTFNENDQQPPFWKGNIVVKSFAVYNRLGNKVFEETNEATLNGKTFAGWDGKKNGSDAASDVYVYLIKLLMPDGKERVESGELNLIR
jgi:CHU_C Type IX secretion signal domain/CUB domain